MSIERFSGIVRAPKYGVEERDSIARSMRIISTASIILGAGLFVAAPWLTSRPVPSMVVYAGMVACSVAGLVLSRRGHLTAATTVFSVTMWLVTTVALVMFGGVSGTVASSYVLLVVIISSVSGWRAGIVATVACIVASGVMAYLEHRGLFPEPVSPLSPLTAWATVVSTTVIAAVTLYLSSRTMFSALRRAHDNERKLAEHSDNLEAVVADRTHELEVAKDAAEAATRDVRLREARFHTLFNQAKVAIWDCDLSRLRASLQAVSAQALAEADLERLRELFGSIEVVAVNGETLRRFDALDSAAFIDGLTSLVAEESRPLLLGLFEGLRSGAQNLEEEGVLYTLGGAPLHVIVGLDTAAGSNEESLQTIVTLSDVTPLHRAREAAQQLAELRANELDRVNKEVERLFYAVSHDLRSPLRGVKNLAEWATDDLSQGDREAVEGHLDKLRERVARLETMMNDLLSFARVGRVAHPVEPVDVSALLDEIREGLVALPDGFDVRWGDMPVVATEKTLLSQVFLNLVGNAIKHHDKPGGVVEISYRAAPDGHEFTVSDDGAGIPERHRERVFDMFATLRRRDVVEGSGMGLALVHKLVSSRGGRIEVAEGPLGGAAFTFTWNEPHAAISSNPPPRLTLF